MFSIMPPESQARIPLTVAAVLAMLLVAFLLSVMAVFQVFDEYRMLGRWLSRADAVSAADIESLRRAIGARIIVRSTASAVLLFCTLATLWLQQRQHSISRALDEVKLTAHDILSSLNDGVITTDQRGIVTGINSAAIGLIGVSLEAIGRPISCISTAQVPLQELCRAVAENRRVGAERELVLDRSGRVRRLVAIALDLKDRQGDTTGCVIHLRDVTERMLIKEQVWRMEQFASLSTMATGLLHEIRNPMTALSIHVQLLEERLRRDGVDEHAADVIGVLKTEVGRLANTLSSFREFASLDRLRLEPTEVRKVLADVARLISPQAEGQAVRLTLLPAEQTLPVLDLDPDKIEQAVLNLVLNALEAMPRGGDLILGTRVDDGRLLVSVGDSGPGIPPEIQDHVFRPYFSTKGSGTGMGLALAEKLVRQHRGRLDFRTGEGGTTFVISLPVDGSGEGQRLP
jgi:PAS domain S-box-containing protein